MAKYEWSEVFLSIEGEAKYSGHPTAYIRFVKCNFTCQGFNNPEMVEITNDVLGFNPSEVKSLNECPPIEIGCDSIYSWDKRFKHMWHKGDENELATALMEVVPHGEWMNPVTGLPTILSLTGGEPTLRAKAIPTLLATKQFECLRHILIETNCAVPLKQSFIDEMNEWANAIATRKLTWSNSPKLSASGEVWEKAIKPEIAVMQNKVLKSEQYFKFVCSNSEEEFDEVEKAMEEYHKAGIPRRAPVYIMPMACTEAQQETIAADVAEMCLDRGYIYCHRVHNSVFANAIGK